MPRILTGVALSLLLSAVAAAQQRKRDGAADSASARRPSLSVIHNPAPAPQTGEISITVRGDENPIIRLQMVASGQTLVEFPASDRIFRVNPADPDLVTIEDSPTKENDCYILLRSSRQFLPGLAELPATATSLLVQMTSGMVVTLLIYPVRELEQAVHRCVVRYDRAAILSARRAVGLAVNLDQPDQPLIQKSPASVQIAPLTIRQTDTIPEKAKAATADESSARNGAEVGSGTTRPRMAVEKEILRALDQSDFRFIADWGDKPKWSRPRHGLMVAARLHTINADYRQVLVMVRNAMTVPLSLVPGHPELLIRTLDERGRSLQIEPIRALKIEASRSDGVIAPGAVARWLITFAMPVLGARQRLSISVAQREAADEPVTLELTNR